MGNPLFFREDRWRLPARLIVMGAGLLIIAFGSSRASARAPEPAMFALVAAGAAGVGVGLVLWGVFRVARPASVASIDTRSFCLRSRDFDSGWQEPWRWRCFESDRIESIEIGPRRDYPRAYSYSDSASYAFLVVHVADSDGRVRRYSYAPLQRVQHHADLLDALRRHPLLNPRIKFVGSPA